MSLMRVDLPIRDIQDASKACLLPVPVRPGGWGYLRGYALDSGEARRGIKTHAVPTSFDPSSTKKSYRFL
jgi:hypothetical protein